MRLSTEHRQGDPQARPGWRNCHPGLFGFALDEGIIDGAIVAATKEFAHKHPEKAMMDNSNMAFNEPWRPIPCVVTTKADMIAAAGQVPTSARTFP